MIEIKHRWTGAAIQIVDGDNLSGADLSDANLSDADLRDADLRGADLRGADLSRIKRDLFEIFAATHPEIAGLRQALADGQIDGSTYEGDCCCLVGTIARNRGCRFDAVACVQPDSDRPAERWFLAIRPGDTPETSQIAKITVEWIDEFLRGPTVTTSADSA